MSKTPEIPREEESPQLESPKYPIRSLGDLANVLEKKQEQEQQERFKTILGGKFNLFPAGNFKTNIPGFESISIFPTLPNKKTGEVTALNVIIFGEEKEGQKQIHQSFNLNREGKLSMPPRAKGLEINRQQLLKEVLDIAQMIDLDFFVDIDEELLPEGEWPKGEAQKSREKSSSKRVVDPRRIEFMKNQPQVLFGFTGINTGFRGYRGFVFPKFVVLENPETQNAAYFIGLEGELVDRNTVRGLTRDQRRRLVEDRILPVLGGLTKQEARERGAERVIHTGVDDTEWGKNMQRAINERLETQ